jgi:multidrug efflux pump subunit AcrA (membrane-fusion protein)
MTVIHKAPGRPKKVWSQEELALKEAKAAAIAAQKALEKEEKAMAKAQEKAAKEQAKAQEKAAKEQAKAAVKAAKAAGLTVPPILMGGGSMQSMQSMHSIPVGLDGGHHHQPPNVEALMAEILQCHMRLGALLGALHNAGHGLC